MIDHLPLILTAAFIVGVSKGGLTSLGSIAVPCLSLVMSPLDAAALLLPVFIASDWVAVWLYRRDYSAPNLRIFVPAVVLGMLVATVAAPALPEAALLILTGLIGLWYCGRSWLGRVPSSAAALDVKSGVFWGLLTGITTFISHTGGPPAQAYLLPQRLPRLEFAGTLTITFAIANLLKIPAYQSVGLFGDIDLRLVLWLVLIGLVGAVIGRRIVLLLKDDSYLMVIEVLLFALSVFLILKGVNVL